MREHRRERQMSETAEERALRLFTAAERMKNSRAKETEEQAAIRRMQEAQRMARHRAKKKALPRRKFSTRNLENCRTLKNTRHNNNHRNVRAQHE